MEAPQKVVIESEPLKASSGNLADNPSSMTSQMQPKKAPPLPPTSHPNSLPPSPQKANQPVNSSSQPLPEQSNPNTELPNSIAPTAERVEVEIIRTTRKKRPNAHPSQAHAVSVESGSGVLQPDVDRNVDEHSPHSNATQENVVVMTTDAKTFDNNNLVNNIAETKKDGARNRDSEDSDSDSSELHADAGANDINSIALNLGKISALLKRNNANSPVAEWNELVVDGGERNDDSNNSSKNLTAANPICEVGQDEVTIVSDLSVPTAIQPAKSSGCVADEIIAELSEIVSDKSLTGIDENNYNDFGDDRIVSVNAISPEEMDPPKAPIMTEVVEPPSPSVESIKSESSSESAPPTTLARRSFPLHSPVRNTLSGNLDTIKILKFNYHVNASFYMIQDLARISMNELFVYFISFSIF
jgi:hypothetical protein